MSDVTLILQQIEGGDPSATEKLLPLVYEELRKLAAVRMAAEAPDHTLQATALVHEAYLRLVGGQQAQRWSSRGHFFGAAAEAMRRILVENCRRKRALKCGGDWRRVELDDADLETSEPGIDLLILSDALQQLASQDPTAAELAKLRIFAGLSMDEAAMAVGLPHTTAYRQWIYAQAWLRTALSDND